MAEESSEYLTLLNCTKKLEIALKGNRDIVHFLERENFISREIHDDILNPKSLLTQTEKSGILVEKIRDKVDLNPENYYSFLNELKSRQGIYKDIIEILDLELQNLQRDK